MSDLTFPHTLVPGTPENVQDVEDNFQAVKAKVNGGITLDNLAAEIQQLLVPTGFLMPAARGSAPNSGWLLCDGASYPRSNYAALVGAIGTAYGGDAVNFNVPDLQGRMAVGKGAHVDVDALGDSDGATLANRRPKHGHAGSAASAGSHAHRLMTDLNVFISGGPSGPINARYEPNNNFYDGYIESAGAHTHTVTVGQQAAGSLVDAPAFVVVAYFIKT
jgi:microcystin-dependent protein